MGKTPIMLLVLGVILVMLLAFFMTRRRKEKWFSRDITYGKANKILWDRYFTKGAAGVAEQDAVIQKTYKYPGYGDFTGMMCRGPNNYRCTTYNTIK